MKWDKKVQQQISWNGEISNQAAKMVVAKKIAAKVKSGQVIGFGSGSTAFLAIQEIGRRKKLEKLDFLAIPTSHEIELLCQNLGISTTTLNRNRPDWGFDGADEVSPENWLIKGRGGAMFREKMLIQTSPKTFILVDDSKFVKHLGEKFPIPVECVPETLNLVREKLQQFGATGVELRLAKGKDGPIITEHGNFILDVRFTRITADLEKKLKSITGVMETGLFIGYPLEIVKQ